MVTISALKDETMDRGAKSTLTFRRCERGFILMGNDLDRGLISPTWAFDTIEALAAWLVEQYKPAMVEGCGVLKPKPTEWTGSADVNNKPLDAISMVHGDARNNKTFP